MKLNINAEPANTAAMSETSKAEVTSPTPAKNTQKYNANTKPDTSMMASHIRRCHCLDSGSD